MYHYVIISDEGYGGLNPVIFGYENCKKAHAFGPAVRTHWLIHYVESGYGYYEIGKRKYRVTPGDIFVIPPYEETFYKADDEKPWNYIWIGFTSDAKLPAKTNDVMHLPDAFAIFNSMKNCEDLKNGRSAFLSARLWDLFSLILRNEKSEEDYVEKALNCIHSEYMNGITIEEIALRLNLNRSYFSSLFKRKMGISPKKYLLNYKMSIAASLMIENGKSVSVAACSVGYTDIFNFSKMFKRHFGVPPHEYRKKKSTL